MRLKQLLFAACVLLISNLTANSSSAEQTDPNILSQSKGKHDSYEECVASQRVSVGIARDALKTIPASDVSTSDRETSAGSYIFMTFYTENKTRFIGTAVCNTDGSEIVTVQKML